ncbi:MAG TPA: nitroreductase family protein, partial [Candidatus Peribacteria bacterium]|nr:nitroreductase family protein [Candidatus Peribacteria bacterium]
WAPSCFGEEPWRYVYATKDDGEKRAALEGLLAEGNAWAKNASLLVLSFAKKTFARNGKPNDYAMHDLGCASGFLVLQATHMNLVSHQMAGFAADKANAVLGVPADFAPGSMIAIGYPGDITKMDESSQKRDASPRNRKPLETIAMRGSWKA